VTFSALLPALPDCDLVARAGTADAPAALAELDRRYRARATRLAHALVRHVWPEWSDEAADIAQEALAKAYLRLRRYDPARPFWPWLAAIVHNTAVGRLRRCRPVCACGAEVAAPQPPPDEELIRKEGLEGARRRCAEFLGALAPRDRDLFLRFYGGGATVTRLAEDHSLAEQTVRCRLTFVKNALLVRLGGLRLSNAELRQWFGG
jgi:RNA polymerase sigma factor (sigma-70 family)